MMIAYYKRIGNIAIRDNVVLIAKIAMVSTLMVIVSTATFNYFSNQLLLVPSLLISVILSGII